MIEFHGVWLDPRTLNSVYEQEEIDIAASLFRPTDRILLAGCGSGLLAATIAAVVKPAALICVEPNPAMAQLVRDNVRVNAAPLYIVETALGAKSGRAILGGGDCWATHAVGADVGEEVSVSALANMVSAYEINALCLDVEGAEYELLADGLPPGIDTALVELHRPPETVSLPFPTVVTPSRVVSALQWGRE